MDETVVFISILTPSERIFINGLPLFCLAAELGVLSPQIVQTPLFLLLIILKELGKKKAGVMA